MSHRRELRPLPVARTATLPLRRSGLASRALIAAVALLTMLGLSSGTEVKAAYESAPRIIATATGLGSAPLGLAVSPDGARVYVASLTSGVGMIDTSTNLLSTTVSMATGPFGVAMTPDGSEAYVTEYGFGPQGRGHTVARIDANLASPGYGTLIGSAIDLGSPPSGTPYLGPEGIAITPDGTRAYIANYGDGTGTPGHTVSVVNLATHLLAATITLPSGSGAYGIAINPAGTLAYVANSASTDMSVIDVNPSSLAYNTVIASIPIGAGTKGVAFSPDGSLAYATSDAANAFIVINTATHAVIHTVPVSPGPIGVAVSPDGSRAYVANNSANSLDVIDTEHLNITANLTGLNSPFGVAINRAGTRVYVSNNGGSGTLTVIDTGWVAPAATGGGTPTPTPTIITLELDANGGSCTASTVAGEANTWVTLPTAGSCIRNGFDFTGWATGSSGDGLTFAPGGQTLLTGDNTLYAIWRTSTPPATATPSVATQTAPAVITASISRSNAHPDRITLTGTITPVTPGQTVTIWFRTKGQRTYQPSPPIALTPNGTFTWTHATARRLYAYLTTVTARSERLTVARA